MNDKSDKEKRRHSRIDSLNLLSYLCMDENEEVLTRGVGRTLNVSKGGILLETHAPFDPNHTISLVIAMKDDLIDIKGKVVDSWTGKNKKYNTRIEFIEANEPALKILKKFTNE